MRTNEEIGKLIREARKRKLLTQEQLADIVHAKKQAVSQWECGKTRPNPESREFLKQFLDIDVYKTDDEEIRKEGEEEEIIDEGNYKMNIKPIETYDNFDELTETVHQIVNSVKVDVMFEQTITTLLELTLFTVLGYECYYKSFYRDINKDPYDVLDWSWVASDIYSLIDSSDSEPIPIDSNHPITYEMSLIETKIKYMLELIGGELFEDFEEDEIRDAYIRRVGRKGESCGYGLLNVLPDNTSSLFTSYKVAMLNMSEFIYSIK